MKSRNEFLSELTQSCLTDLYKWSQPSADFNSLIKKYKESVENGTNDIGEDFFTHYYLSKENFDYIVNNYIEAYHIGRDWNEDIDFFIEYITGKPYNWTREKDEYGYKLEQMQSIPNLQERSPEHYEEILDLIKTCKKFYGRDLVRERFTVPIYLNASPTNSKESVISYWREHGYPEFDVKDFDIDKVIYTDIYDNELSESEDYDDNLSFVDNFINSLKLPKTSGIMDVEGNVSVHPVNRQDNKPSEE